MYRLKDEGIAHLTSSKVHLFLASSLALLTDGIRQVNDQSPYSLKGLFVFVAVV